jgi:NhaA family Na+:H+ antiporter
LSTRKSAALPVAAAIGGMVVPILLYKLILPERPWAHGWGIPMATDTAFAIALIVMMGARVPIELRIFLTAAAIVDDIAAIIVVALFYSSDLNIGYMAGAGVMTGLLALLNRWGVYGAGPYALVAIGLWICVHAAGLHATLAAVILALFIPTRPPANLHGLMAQVNAIAKVESQRSTGGIGHGLSTPALSALGAIHARLESPAARMLHHVEPWSSYFVLPLFALANAGVVFSAGVWAGHAQLMSAIMVGLVVGKPLGMVLATGLAVRLGIATKPDVFSWAQVTGAGVLAGIGFTMSLFIADQAFPVPADFAAAKIAIYMASTLAAILGVLILWKASSRPST